MKVLYVIPGSSNPNAFSFSKEQIACTQQTGIETYTFQLESRLNPFTLVREYFRYKKELKSFNPDIVHAHYGTVNGYFATLGHNKPFVITFHGSDLNTSTVGRFRDKLGKFLSRVTAKKADHIICVSQKLKDKLGTMSHKADIIPMGADDIFFQPLDMAPCRETLGFDKNTRYVLFNGSDPVVKRLALAEATMLNLKDKIFHSEMVVLSGKLSKDTIKLYLNACDALLVCSISEGSPVIVKEAMACNLPIVSNDVGDIKQVIDGTFPGIITEDDPRKLSEALHTIFSGLRRSNGRNILHQKGLTIQKSVDKITDIYKNLK
jgi:teichuronic acid biosynthesis glycosyltransferase TuaC